MRHCICSSFQWPNFTRRPFKTLLTKQVQTEGMTKSICIFLKLQRLKEWEQRQSYNKKEDLE